MLHAYVDESYTDDWFFMAASIASSTGQQDELSERFRLILETASRDLTIPLPTEVHGYELMQGAGEWRDVSIPNRIDVALQVLSAIKQADVRFIIRGIDRKAQRRRYREAYEPYPLVLTHIMREVDKYAAARETEARLVCDEIHQDDRHRAMLDRHRAVGTPGYKPTTLAAVVGDLEFVESRNSAMVQAADVLAYLEHRAASRPAPSRLEARTRRAMWRLIESQVDHRFCWAP